VNVYLEIAEHAETRLQAKKSMWLTKRWRKWRDAPLGDVVAFKLQRRAERGMGSAPDSEARIERILSSARS
jgi:hypothetical protein